MPLLHPRGVLAERRGHDRAVAGRREHQLEDPLLAVVHAEQPLLEHGAELFPEGPVVFRPLVLHLLEGAEQAPDEVPADGLDLAVLLEDLARHVERQIVAGDDAADEAEPGREQLLAVVHDEHAPHVELHPAPGAIVPEIEGRLRRDVEQRPRLEAALDVDGEVLERVVPVARDVLVELAILLLGDLVLGTGPDRLHRVQRVGPQPDRIGHEVRVLLDGLAQGGRLRVVREPVLGVAGLEVQRHAGPRAVPLRLLDGVAVAAGLPARGRRLAGAPAQDRDPVGDHEARVEADAEPADQLRRHHLARALAQRGQELARARARDRADVLDDLLPAHPDAVVAHGQGSRRGVRLQVNRQLVRGRQLGAGQRLESPLVERVRGVRDQLPQEDLLVGVEGVDHQVQELPDLGLELVAFGGLAHGPVL